MMGIALDLRALTSSLLSLMSTDSHIYDFMLFLHTTCGRCTSLAFFIFFQFFEILSLLLALFWSFYWQVVLFPFLSFSPSSTSPASFPCLFLFIFSFFAFNDFVSCDLYYLVLLYASLFWRFPSLVVPLGVFLFTLAPCMDWLPYFCRYHSSRLFLFHFLLTTTRRPSCPSLYLLILIIVTSLLTFLKDVTFICVFSFGVCECIIHYSIIVLLFLLMSRAATFFLTHLERNISRHFPRYDFCVRFGRPVTFLRNRFGAGHWWSEFFSPLHSFFPLLPYRVSSRVDPAAAASLPCFFSPFHCICTFGCLRSKWALLDCAFLLFLPKTWARRTPTRIPVLRLASLRHVRVAGNSLGYYFIGAPPFTCTTPIMPSRASCLCRHGDISPLWWRDRRTSFVLLR